RIGADMRSAAPLLLLPLALLAACASTRRPQPVTVAKPAETAPAAPSPPQDAAPPAPTPPKPPGGKEGEGSQVVVDDPGDDAGSHPKSLVEAAREERERRAHAGEPVAVITNKTVATSKGQITYAQPKTKTGEKPAGKDGKGKAGEHDE